MEVSRTIARFRMEMNHWSSSPGGLTRILVLEALSYKCAYGNSIPCISTLPRASLKHALTPKGRGVRISRLW